MSFCPVFLLAQSAPPIPQAGWQAITISDELSQGMIFDLTQGKKGYIWVLSKDGLNRYDGNNFKVFTHDPYNELSLSGNNCLALLIDQQERIWIGAMNKALNLFDPRTERFYHLTLNPQTTQKNRQLRNQPTDRSPRWKRLSAHGGGDGCDEIRVKKRRIHEKARTV